MIYMFDNKYFSLIFLGDLIWNMLNLDFYNLDWAKIIYY